MLDATTKRRIDDARDILVGKIPDPKSQVEQITIALIYKFMDDMDTESEELGGTAKFFVGDYKKYSWRKVFNKTRGGQEILLDYREALQKMSENPSLPSIFHTIFRQAYLPYNDPETLKEFLKIIDQFDYDHSEKLGDAFEYLLSVLGSQGDAGQFRTPRHIIDFMVELVEPKKGETILDPACGTAGFLISAYKYILKHNSSEGKDKGDLLTPDERKRLSENISGYDISPDMVRLSLVNMYLHKITEPKITEYDTLTSDKKWNEYFDVVLANPPFMSPKGGIKPHSRFSVQSKRSEALFVDYIAEHLTITGRGAVIVPEGVIFKSDTAFTKLRKMLVEDHYLYGVISLPSGVFNPYSGVKTSILLFDKVIAKLTDKILFAKVENDGFGLGAQRRPVEGSQLEGIVSAIKEFKVKLHCGEAFESSICTFVEKSKIAESGDYNLSGERYITARQSNSAYAFKPLAELFSEIKNGTNVEQIDEIGKYRVTRIQTISNGYVDLDKTKWTNDEVSDDKFMNVGDILLSHINSYEHLGKSAIFTIPNEKVIHGINLIRFRPIFEIILPEYAISMFKSQSFIDIARSFAQKAVNQASIKTSDLKNIEIPLPSIEVQRAIVAEIEGYQKIIDAARTIADNYCPQITIEPSWQMVELGKIGTITSSKRIFQDEYVENGIPFYRTKEVVELSKGKDISLELYISENKYNEIKSSFDIPKTGDILISAVGTIGVSWIVPNDNPFYFKDGNLIWIKDIEEASPLYIKTVLDSIVANNIDSITNGAAYNALTIVNLKKVIIPLPDLETQQQIVAEIEREQAAVDSAKELIEIFAKKITTRIAQIWNE